MPRTEHTGLLLRIAVLHTVPARTVKQQFAQTRLYQLGNSTCRTRHHPLSNAVKGAPCRMRSGHGGTPFWKARAPPASNGTPGAGPSGLATAKQRLVLHPDSNKRHALVREPLEILRFSQTVFPCTETSPVSQRCAGHEVQLVREAAAEPNRERI